MLLTHLMGTLLRTMIPARCCDGGNAMSIYQIAPGVFSTKKPEPPKKPEPVIVEEAPPKKKRTSKKKTEKTEE